MKKANITFSYDEEKLNAIRLSLTDKNLDLDAEMNSVLETLYKKYVHPAVRIYIESRDAGAAPSSAKRTANQGKEQNNA